MTSTYRYVILRLSRGNASDERKLAPSIWRGVREKKGYTKMYEVSSISTGIYNHPFQNHGRHKTIEEARALGARLLQEKTNIKIGGERRYLYEKIKIWDEDNPIHYEINPAQDGIAPNETMTR